MFKNIFFVFSFVFIFIYSGFSQLEVKTNPVAILFQTFPLSIEYVINDSNGAEGILYFTGDFIYSSFNYKYYFKPKLGGDGFYVGSFISLISDFEPGFGFHLGYKIVGNNKLLFDVGLGLGRALDGDSVGTGQLSIGYRLTGTKKG